ncbi:hypothetical protein [Roseofilum casamattae]|uniref:Uncharacterized protein n=1 Tax=Roseofilum casamattae BLCC-M143 TaxID=3022442 RepID=A0ABT7C267_9CYAN|nr:hypothetical protein [Roseofilum casamattae]MDJ1185549.1 hypothetical protein [Roseofilum casamattae BLCC-M143]
MDKAARFMYPATLNQPRTDALALFAIIALPSWFHLSQERQAG